MKKNFWSWVPTDRPWALYPLKANSHSACLNIVAQPLPSHSLHSLPLPPPPFPSHSSSILAQLHVLAVPGCRSWPAVGRGLVDGMQVQDWLQGERGGECFIVELDNTLSPLEHPLMGESTDNRILIWLCKCLLQKAIRCNPYPVVRRQEQGRRRKWRRGSRRNSKR